MDAPWRCGWCSCDRDGDTVAGQPGETTGLCEPCLAKHFPETEDERDAA